MKNKDKIINAYYVRNPQVFIEEYFDIKLNWFQRFFLKLAFVGTRKKVKGNAKKPRQKGQGL